LLIFKNFGSTVVWIQDLRLATQVPCYLIHFARLHACYFFPIWKVLNLNGKAQLLNSLEQNIVYVVFSWIMWLHFLDINWSCPTNTD
jgi:hypothetical protein